MKEDVKLSVLRSCVKVEVAVLGSPSLIVYKISVDVNNTERKIAPASGTSAVN